MDSGGDGVAGYCKGHTYVLTYPVSNEMLPRISLHSSAITMVHLMVFHEINKGAR